MLYISCTNADLSPYFSDFVFGLYRGKFVDIPHVNHFRTVMDLRISNVADYRTFSIFTPRRLAARLHGQNQLNYIKDSHQQFEKNTFVSIKT